MLIKVKKALSSVRLSFRVIWSVASYNLRITYRYPANVIFAVAMPVLFILMAALFSNVVENALVTIMTGGESSLPRYLAAGLGVWFISNSMSGIANAVETEIGWGTLASSLFSPATPAQIMAGLALSNLIYGGSIGALVLVPLACLFGLTAPHLGLLRLLLGLVVLYGMGMLFAALAMRWRRVGGLISALAFAEQFFCGVFIPVRLLPVGLRCFSYAFPQTWVIDGVRSAFLGVDPLLPARTETILLAALAALVNGVGFAALRLAEKRVRQYGLSEQY